MIMLHVNDLYAGYTPADMILKGVSIEIAASEVVCIIGPNGAGKSTLLKGIAGLLYLTSGEIVIGAAPMNGKTPAQIAHSGVAFVPQERNIFPSMTVRENLELGGYVRNDSKSQMIEEIFKRFPLLAEKRSSAARSLSGGQRQILAMAMALMVSPSVLLLDEPTAGLSPKASQEVLQLIRELAESGLAVALVEQNAHAALCMSDRAYILVDGKNAKSGPASDLSKDADIRRVFLGMQDS